MDQVSSVQDHRGDEFHGLLFGGRKQQPRSLSFRAGFSSAVSRTPVKWSRAHQELTYTPEHLRFVLKILELGGLSARGYRLPPLIRRVPACLRALKTECPTQALELLQSSPKKFELAVNALLIGTTSFFRDAAVFETLEQVVFPKLAAMGRTTRFLSVACSGGEELYSVAMLFAKHGDHTNARFLGRDCRPSAVATARRACYPAHAEATIPPDLATRYMIRQGNFLSIHPDLAKHVEWECDDALAARVENSEAWDLILCRNLAIYLEPKTTQRLWDNLCADLVPGGILVVGRAEKPQLLELAQIGPCIYRKTDS